MGKKHGTLTKAGKVILYMFWFNSKQVRKATPKVKNWGEKNSPVPSGCSAVVTGISLTPKDLSENAKKF